METTAFPARFRADCDWNPAGLQLGFVKSASSMFLSGGRGIKTTKSQMFILQK
jgi:hypothetical protein